LVTMGIVAIVSARMLPSSMESIVAPLLTLGVVLIGIRVMFHPFFPMKW